MRLIVLLLLLAGMARAEPDRPGEFDYWLLALSWSPGWCAVEGDARSADQCAARHDHGFLLHGLWPQFEAGGWPEFCKSPHAPPARAETRAMADIMGSGGRAWHQWRKHGTCSGLAPRAYFEASRRTYRAVGMPPVFRRLGAPRRLAPSLVEEAFAEVNPGLTPDMMVVSCVAGRITELRICLDRAFAPRPCGDGLRGCAGSGAVMDPVR